MVSLSVSTQLEFVATYPILSSYNGLRRDHLLAELRFHRGHTQLRTSPCQLYLFQNLLCPARCEQLHMDYHQHIYPWFLLTVYQVLSH